MKPARGLGLVLLFIGVCAVAQTISYFNQGFLRQPDAATDRAYLGITNVNPNLFQAGCLNLTNWCAFTTNILGTFTPTIYSVNISNYMVGVSNIVGTNDIRPNRFNLWWGTNYFTNSIVISNSFNKSFTTVNRATLRIINTNVESTVNPPFLWHATDLLGGGNLIFTTNKFTIAGNAHLNGACIAVADDVGGTTSAALELRGAPVMIGSDNQNYIAFFNALNQAAMFDTYGCLEVSGLLGSSGSIFGTANGGIRATNAIYTSHAYMRSQYGNIVSSNSWTHITPATYVPNNLASGDTFTYGDNYYVSSNGWPVVVMRNYDGTYKSLPIPDVLNYVQKSGDIMTGALSNRTFIVVEGTAPNYVRVAGTVYADEFHLGTNSMIWSYDPVTKQSLFTQNGFQNMSLEDPNALGGIAFGRNAFGVNAGAAFGMQAIAWDNSFAGGPFSTANANGVSIGNGSKAATYGVAVGDSANAAANATALGYWPLTAPYSIAIGYRAHANEVGGEPSIAIGRWADADAPWSIAIGVTNDPLQFNASVASTALGAVEIGAGQATTPFGLHYRGQLIANSNGVVETVGLTTNFTVFFVDGSTNQLFFTNGLLKAIISGIPTFLGFYLLSDTGNYILTDTGQKIIVQP